MFGKSEDHPLIAPHVEAAQAATTRVIEKAAALVQDETQPSQPEKNAASRDVAKQAASVVASLRDAIKATATELMADTEREMNCAFAPDPSRAALETEIRGWIRYRSRGGAAGED